MLQNLRAEHRPSEVRLHCQFAPAFSAQQTERHKPVTFAAVVKTKTEKVFAGRVLDPAPKNWTSLECEFSRTRLVTEAGLAEVTC